MESTLRQEWAAIPLALIRKLILSLWRRCRTGFKAAAGPTKFWIFNWFFLINEYPVEIGFFVSHSIIKEYVLMFLMFW